MTRTFVHEGIRICTRINILCRQLYNNGPISYLHPHSGVVLQTLTWLYSKVFSFEISDIYAVQLRSLVIWTKCACSLLDAHLPLHNLSLILTYLLTYSMEQGPS